MAAAQTSLHAPHSPGHLSLQRIGTFPRIRVLAWQKNTLYAGRGYELLRANVSANSIEWRPVASYSPAWWRKVTASIRLSCRLFRDGFHALAVLSSGHLVAAVPGAVITLEPGHREFRVSHRILRGTRPLHFAVTPDNCVFWGEYFDNPAREEVHIYVSTDRGATWDVAYTFPRSAIRHVHNIVYDRFAKCLWILAGDVMSECRIIRASCDFSDVEVVHAGDQQARAVALVPGPDGIYFSSDTPLEMNYIYHHKRQGKLSRLVPLSSSSIYGCRVGETIFFSTMVEPSAVNIDRNARLYGSLNGQDWQALLSWQKDRWPPGLFQYGNILLPDGENTSGVLALSTIAVQSSDQESSLWSLAPPLDDCH